MRSREYFWSLFHSSENNQLDNLRTDQVEAVFAALPASMHKDWLIWRDGFDGWKPFVDFPQLLLSLRKTEKRAGEFSPPPPKKREKTHSGKTNPGVKSTGKTKPGFRIPIFDQDSDLGDELTFMPTGSAEDRGNFRFDKSFEIKIVAGEKSYTNKTVNISLKGMQVKSPLPKSLPRYFNVEIRNGKRTIPVVCSEVKPLDGSASTRLKIEVNDFTPGLLAMLLAG